MAEIQASVPSTKSAAFAPDTLAAVMASAPASGPVLVLLTVTGCGVRLEAAVPANWLPKSKLVGTEIAACVAVPDTATLDGFAPGTLSVADRLPGAVLTTGLKDTFSWQVAAAPRLAAQEFPSTKTPAFALLSLIPLMSAAVLPGFVIVTLCGALVRPSLCGAKERLAGDS